MINMPTLSELYNSYLSELEAELGVNIPTFGKNYLRAQAAVQAAKMKLFYLAIGKVQRNIFIDTAEPEASGGTLERFGRVKLGRNPFAARAGQYVVEVSGSSGGVINAGTTFKSNDDSKNPGKLFILDTAYTLSDITGEITLRALEAGTGSELEINDKLTATIPIALVNAQATVLSESVTPLAAEDLEDYRRKAIDSYRLEPNGGAATDYRLWATDAPGVLRVYPYATPGQVAEIDIYVEATPEDSEDGKGTPSQDIIDGVEEVVEFDPDTTKPLYDRGRRPLGTFRINFMPVEVKDVDIVINSFAGLSTTIEDAIESALGEEIADIRPFVSGAEPLEDKNDILDVNRIISVILQTRPGSSFGTVELTVGGVSVTTYTFTGGDIPYLNSVTFVP